MILAMVSIVSVSSAFAVEVNHGPVKRMALVCKSEPTKLGAETSLTITNDDEYNAAVSGSQSGGMAHYIRKIGPMNVKIDHEADLTRYTNSEEKFELSVVYTVIGGVGHTTATLSPGLAMTCENTTLNF